MYYTLYKTTNLINSKFYIGIHSTENLCDTYIGSGILLRKAIKKYGRPNFKKEILCCVDDIESLIELEEFVVDVDLVARSDTYNLIVGGIGYEKGRAVTEKERARLKAIRVGQRPALGMTHSDESKRKISEASLGNKHNLGKSLSEETKRKISVSLMGNTRSLGTTQTEETRRKISISLVGNTRSLSIKQSPETIQKRIETRRRNKEARQNVDT
jgi:group I intron endonuclease